MAKCNNCGAKLGCSCKKRTASDGKSCCANCIANYERIIKKSGSTTSRNTAGVITTPGVILSASAKQID